MATKRMLSKEITESDAFLEMPTSSQALYFHLNLNADDEGFVDAPNKVARNCGANRDDLNILLIKNFIIAFANGVIVIVHWKIHNWIRKDRIKGTNYIELKNLLFLEENDTYTKDENPTARKVSKICQTNVRQETDKCPKNVNIEQTSLDQSSLEQSSIDQSSLEEMSDEIDDDDSLEKIVDVFEQEITNVTLTEEDKKEILNLLDDLPEDMIIKAILQASPYKPKSWNYIKVILDSCVKDGVKEKLNFNNNKSKNSKTGKYDDVYKN